MQPVPTQFQRAVGVEGDDVYVWTGTGTIPMENAARFNDRGEDDESKGWTS